MTITKLNTTDVFTYCEKVVKDGKWEFEYSPVKISDVVVATLARKGQNYQWEPEMYDQVELQRICALNYWNLELYEDDENLAERWFNFCAKVNEALVIVQNTLDAIDR